MRIALLSHWNASTPHAWCSNEARDRCLYQSTDENAARDLAATMRNEESLQARDAEPRPLPDAPSPMAFDMALLPGSLRPWVDDMAERLQCPPEPCAATALVGAGSILGNRIGVRPQENRDWTECPNLWGMIVGRPGTMKSPAMSQALAPLRRLQVQAREVHAEAMTRHACDMEAHELREKEPGRSRQH